MAGRWLTERSSSSSLRDLVHDADWLNRAIPTFDEVSYGLPRLVAAGLCAVDQGADGMTLRATSQAVRLRRAVQADSLGGMVLDMEAAIGRSFLMSDTEDRSLGRLPGLDPQAWDEAIRAHGAWMARWSWPLIASGIALSIVVSFVVYTARGLISVLAAVGNLRNRER